MRTTTLKAPDDEVSLTEEITCDAIDSYVCMTVGEARDFMDEFADVFIAHWAHPVKVIVAVQLLAEHWAPYQDKREIEDAK